MELLLSTPAPAGGSGFAGLCLPPAAGALVALLPDQCRWPLGETDRADFAFCSEPRTSRGAYCTAHTRRARLGARP